MLMSAIHVLNCGCSREMDEFSNKIVRISFCQEHINHNIDTEFNKLLVRAAKKKEPEANKPTDYDYCPHCRGRFSFNKPGDDFLCPFCKKDIRDTDRYA